MSEKYVLLREPRSTYPRSKKTIEDWALGVCKMAAGRLADKEENFPNWTSDSFEMDIFGALGSDRSISNADYAKVAELATKKLGVFVPINYEGTRAEVSLMKSVPRPYGGMSTPRFHIRFHKPQLPEGPED